MAMQDIRKAARENMNGFCRVCPVCNGVACSGEVPGMGGIGSGVSFRNNVNALAALRLNMRCVHGVTAPDCSTTLLGETLSLPLLAAPIGGVSFNMGSQTPEADYVDAILQGCEKAGTIGCTGDGVPTNVVDASLDGVAKAKGHGIPFIKPWESSECAEKITRAAASKCRTIGMDIDAAGLITLRLMGRPVAPKTPEQLRAVVDLVHSFGCNFILKGVMTPEDACAAFDAGAEGIVVSNHGGRVLDACPGTAEVLPAIARAIREREAARNASEAAEQAAGQGEKQEAGTTQRQRFTILIDGGIRTGADIVKCCALGADAVLIGRPFCVAALGGGADGVAEYIEKIKSELTQSMLLTGCANIRAIGEHVLYRKEK